MIIRLSQKLNIRIKAGMLSTLPLDLNPLADWSAHLFVADRTQYILFSNTKSLYSTVFIAKGITTDGRFIDAALNQLRELMEADGLRHVFEEQIAPNSGSIQFGKALSREVTGSMNELILAATHCLVINELSPHQTTIDINGLLLSAIATSQSEKYRRPREAFLDLVGKRSD